MGAKGHAYVRNAPASSEVTAVPRVFGFADLLLGTVFLQAAHAEVMNALGYGLGALCLGAGVVFVLLSPPGARGGMSDPTRDHRQRSLT